MSQLSFDVTAPAEWSYAPPADDLSDLEFNGAEERLAECGQSVRNVWAPRPCRCVKPRPIATADEDEARCLNCGRVPS